MGYRCYRYYNNSVIYGFVTAGHGGVTSGQPVYNSAGTEQIGVVMGVYYNNGGYTDNAFIWTNSNCSVSTTIPYNMMTVQASCANPAKNATVYYVGYQSYVAYGTVNVASIDYVSTDGKQINDCFQVSGSATPGDSGGLAYILSGNTRTIAGTIRANAIDGIIMVKGTRITAAGCIPY